MENIVNKNENSNMSRDTTKQTKNFPVNLNRVQLYWWHNIDACGIVILHTARALVNGTSDPTLHLIAAMTTKYSVINYKWIATLYSMATVD